MPDQPDPKEVKLLADILALVLEDQPGQSATALDAIRRRAAASRTTGGALKNLFLRLTLPAPAETDLGATHPQRELDAAKLEIAELKSERTQLQRSVAEAQSRYADALEQRKSGVRIGAACGVVGVLGAAAIIIVVGSVRTTTPAPSRNEVATIEHPPTPAPPPPSPAPTPTAARLSAPLPPAQPLRLTEDARRAVADHVRTCWMQGTEAFRPARAAFDIQVQIDESGTIRDARLTGADEAARTDPNFHTFADQAVRALLDPRCATLPLPPTMLGRRTILDFHFAP